MLNIGFGIVIGIGLTLFLEVIYSCLVASGKEDKNERD